MAAEEYQQVLLEGDVVQLGNACSDAARFGLSARLRALRDRLMVVAPAPQPFSVVMANTRALVACKAPGSARKVLSRFGPGTYAQRREWLVLSWRTAAAARDNEAAVFALRRLATGDLTQLEAVRLELGNDANGMAVTRSALDQLADHEAALNRIDRAAAVALSARSSGVEGARRLAQAARWLESLGQNDATTILETALDQAAVAQAWSLAEELLNIQLRMERQAGGDGAWPRQRLERLASRVDDRYTLWQLLQDDPQSPEIEARRLVLEQQLRSPRQVGASTLEESEQEGPDGSDSPAIP
jgi:hypothetical protein